MLRGDLTAFDIALQNIQKTGFIAALTVQPAARGKSGAGEGHNLRAKVTQRHSVNSGLKAKTRHLVAQGLALLCAPSLDQIPGCIQRILVIEQAYKQSGQRT